MFHITITATGLIATIKAIREVADCGLKTSKDMVDHGIITADTNELSAAFNMLQSAWLVCNPEYRFTWTAKEYTTPTGPVYWSDRHF